MSNQINFTKAALDALPLPAQGQRSTYHDVGGRESVPGLQLRITANGAKTFSVFKRIAGGKPERFTIGRYPMISIDQARKKAKAVVSQLAQGESPAATKREDNAKSLTLADAIAEYVRDKRRTDGLPLKERTRDDYLAMVAAGRLTAEGKHTRGGYLHKLASKPIHSLTAADIRAVHTANLERGERQSFYAMQTLRAVLAWHGVVIPHSPFSRETHGRDRIRIPKSPASAAEPVEDLLQNIGTFWQALEAMPQSPATDYLRFLMLTGCRPCEPLRVLIADCNLQTGKVTLRDTKNRTDHVLRLSSQALLIVERAAEGKRPEDRLFSITEVEASKAAHALVASTGLEFTPKMARSAFASIAEELVSAATLKRLMNHRQAGDITNTNYVRKLEDQLRAGWQAVADYIDEQASENALPIREAASCSSN